VAHSPADPRGLAARWTGALLAGPIGPAALGGGLSLGLLLLYVTWESAFGHFHFLAEHSLWAPETTGPRIAVTVIVLMGFMVGTHVYGRRELVRDVEDLGPLLLGSSSDHSAWIREAESAGRRAGSWLGSVVAIPIGLLVVTSDRPGVPFLLSDDPWNHDLVWALAANALLFSILGHVAVQTFRTNHFLARIESQLAPVDLLRPQSLEPLARRGLRIAFLWIGGSSIASIIFVNLEFSWLTGVVLVVTLLIGTIAFVEPLRGLRRRIRDAKEAELGRVRAAIRRARDGLLDPASPAEAAARMPGLLAYEQRISSVPEWPVDPPQIARFGLVILIGLGSWLGGAVVGHLLDRLWR